MKPDLVILAVPANAAATSDEEFVRSYSWTLNWSLSFGHQEWDCVVVHPSVVTPDISVPRGELIRQLVHAQDLTLIDRPNGDRSSAEVLFTNALKQSLYQGVPPMRRWMIFAFASCLAATAVAAEEIRLTVQEPAGVQRQQWPVTSGIPLAQGRCGTIKGRRCSMRHTANCRCRPRRWRAGPTDRFAGCCWISRST